jgi:tetratricopeptide (TPR) repeat protein
MGEWDLCVERADAFLRAVEEGARHVYAANAYGRRGLISFARGDDAAALVDTERALELGRQVGDPQVLITVLLDAVHVQGETGDEAGAAELFDEALDRIRDVPHIGFAVFYAHNIAWLARVFGREPAVEEIFSRRKMPSRWLDAGHAVLEGDLHGAAEILAEIDTPAFEAFFRLRAAEQFVAEGRRAEADDDLRRALAFYRGVRATRYVREGEALLAASA